MKTYIYKNNTVGYHKGLNALQCGNIILVVWNTTAKNADKVFTSKFPNVNLLKNSSIGMSKHEILQDLP